MKKLAVILTAIMMIAVLAGCTADSGSGNTPNDSKGDSGNAQQQEPKTSDKGKIGDYEIAIKDAKIIKDYSGAPSLLVTFDFTNNSDSDAAFTTSVADKAFQDGVGLERAIVVGSSEYTAADSLKSVKPGTTYEVKSLYKLANEESDVLVEVTDLLSLGDVKLSKTFVIKQ